MAIPTEAEQIHSIEEAERAIFAPFAFSVAQDAIDDILRTGSNTSDHRMLLVAEFSKQKPLEDMTETLRRVYHGGNGIATELGRITAWYAEDGIHLATGETARYTRTAQVLSWTDAAKRIGELLEEGRFATSVELAEAAGYERYRLADQLWSLYRDLSEEAGDSGYLSCLVPIRGNGAPEETARLAEHLSDPVFRQALKDEYAAFWTAYQQDQTLLRFHYHRLREIWQGLKDLDLPRRSFSSDATEIPPARQFITEDEINESLAGGGLVSGSKGRIFAFFQQPRSAREKAEFLKEEYGTGGRSHALSNADGSDESHDAKGVRYRKRDCPAVHFSWEKVSRRITDLIRKGRYLTEQEQAEHNKTQAEKALAEEDAIQPPKQDIDLHEAGAGADDAQTERAKELINAFCQREYDSEADFSDLSKIGVAYTTVTEEEIPIQVEIDLVNARIVRYLDGDHLDDRRYGDLQELISNELEALDFGELTYVSDDDAARSHGHGRPEQKPDLEKSAGELRNYRITDERLGEGGPKEKFKRNVEAIRVLKALEADNRPASTAEQEILAQYVGWGGLADSFDKHKAAWASEYAQLRNLLTQDEYNSAMGSVLNAHYTSPTVIRAIYDAVEQMGFTSGNILEPAMGVGNFFGMMPDSMRDSRLYGMELDSISGRIAKQLYPKADIIVTGFETTDRRDFFDLAVGNVPFGNYKVDDKAYNRLGFSIHNYFIAKMIDQVRPGGLVAVVTSRYTMDQQSPEVRKYLAERAELLGAIRLPNNAFRANAGTDVVADILFFQKRERAMTIEPDWVHLSENADGFAINQYFVDHPEMILGEPTSESTQYGKQDFTVVPREGVSLADQLHEAIGHIHGVYREASLPDLGEGEALAASIPADPNVKNYSYTIVDGQVYYRENSIMVRPDLNPTAQERVKGLVGLRDCVHALIDAQMDEAGDSAIQGLQAELNQRYDAFTAKYGLINARGNALAFSDDSSYYLLCSLEVLDDQQQLKRKADMFTKRTIKQQKTIDHVDTAVEALAVSISERVSVNLPFMSQLTGKAEDDLAQELTGVIFPLPESLSADQPLRYVTADEYLSGNVRQKLRDARFAAQDDARFSTNVAALEAAQPQDLDASDIDIRLGATWIDKEIYQKFMYETFRTPFYQQRMFQVNYSPYTAEWFISSKTRVSSNDVAACSIYGTTYANAYKILEDSLNLRDTRIYDVIRDADGNERRVLNQRETTLAQQKQQAIKDAFHDWVWRDPDRRHQLVQEYNERFNSIRLREYDGSHIAFAGMNPEIALREHQRNAVAHILYGGNTLLAHEVGAGKTFEMIAACMESKRLGLCQKAMFVVPNHLTEQWASEFLRLYPSANILVTTKKDFERRNRQKFCARIATGDYDAVIIGHSQFERIPVSAERQQQFIEDQIDEITAGIEELSRSRGDQFSIKQLVRTRKQLEVKLKKLQAEDRKDDVVTFEQLGVDRLYVDEAHGYKNCAKRCA